MKARLFAAFVLVVFLALLAVVRQPTLAGNNVEHEAWNVEHLYGDNVWTQCSQGMWGGDVYALALSPGYATDHTIFAGTDGYGIFKSSDGGASWSAVNTGLTNQTVLALALSPGYTSDHILFAGTWGGGVFKSTDGGASWSAVNTGLTNQQVYALALSPGYTSDHILFAGTWGGGVFKSTNCGASWSVANTGLTNREISALALSPGYATDSTIFAGTSSGVFKSTNGGASWGVANTGLTSRDISALALSPGYVTDRTLFTGTNGGVFKSTNGGASWSAVNTGLPNLWAFALALSPSYASDHTIFAGIWGGGVFKSTDGGASWSTMNTDPTSLGVYTLVLSPSYTSDRALFAGTSGGGVFKSTDGGASWSAVNAGLTNLDVLVLVLSPGYASDRTLFAGTDGGGVFKSTDGCASWSAVNMGLTSMTSLTVWILALSPGYTTDHTIFAGTLNGVFKSTNGGASWSTANTGLTNLWVYALATSPGYTTDHTLFAGTDGGVFKSTDGGASWSVTGLPSVWVSALVLSPGYATDHTLFAGTDSGIFKSTDGGASWSAANTGLTNLDVWVLALSPGYPTDHTIFAGTNDGGVFKSTNSGVSWSASGLANLDVLVLALSPGYATDYTLFAGTWGGGVFRSTDGGVSWSAMNAGLGSLNILSLALASTSPCTLFAGTGGSVWQYTFVSPTPTPTPTPEIAISHTEVTQIIQDETNSVPLIAGKPTFVRVYLDCGEGCTAMAGVTGVLHGYGRDGEFVDSPIPPVNRPITAYHESWLDQRGVLTKTLNFTLPPKWTSGTTMLIAEAGGARGLPVTMPFQPTRSLRVAYIPIHYYACGYDAVPDMSAVTTAHSLAQELLPVGSSQPIDIEVWHEMPWSSPLKNDCSKPATRDNINEENTILLLRTLEAQWFTRGGNNPPDYVFGWLPSGAFDRGVAWPRPPALYGVAAFSDVFANEYPLEEFTWSKTTFVHELGHLMGHNGINTGDCPSDDSGSGWPWSDSRIHDWGVDGNNFAWLLSSESALKNPQTTYDYMSYCGWKTASNPEWNLWTSTWTYTVTLGSLATEQASRASSALQPYFLSSGLVFTDNTAVLEPVWVITPTLTPDLPPVGTEYCIEAQNASGTVLSSRCFDLAFRVYEISAQSNVDGFNLMLPYPPGVARIVLKKGPTELASRSVSAHAPVVNVLSPNGGEVWATSGTYTVTWSASDADGDPLTYRVLYSPDGTNWMPVGSAITETQLAVNAAELAGGSGAKVRVLTTDGVNTSADESDAPFTVGRKGPQAFILSPEGDGIIKPGTPLLLQGYAYDLEDGTLGESALRWTSSQDGDLGTGSQVLVSLSPGQHVITLTATDSDGNTATATINVFGGYKTYLPLILRKY